MLRCFLTRKWLGKSKRCPTTKRSTLSTTTRDLLVAVATSHHSEAKALLEEGADANAFDDCGWTALVRAAHNGHVHVVRMLLEWGAHIEKRDSRQQTALFRAASGGHNVVVMTLLEYGAEVDATDATGSTALIRAAWRGDTDIVLVLLEGGADFDASNDAGWTALMFAAWNGHTDIVQLLLDRGADSQTRTKTDVTALDLANLYGRQDIIKLLRHHALHPKTAPRSSMPPIYKISGHKQEAPSTAAFPINKPSSSQGVVSHCNQDSRRSYLRFAPDGDESAPETANTSGLQMARETPSLCVICLDKPQTSGVVHNRIFHKCYCADCVKLEQVKRIRRCPLCKETVDLLIDMAY